MKKGLLLTMLTLFLIMTSCNKDDEGTELFKTAYTGNELNIHAGLYYHISDDNEIINPFFFYRDGVVIDPGAIDQEKINNFRDAGKWEDEIYFNESKSHWGIFEISNSDIKIEQWIVFQSDPLKTIIYKGMVMSDTSFVISEVVNNRTGEIFQRNQLYELERFTPKPDSTNTFIE